MGECHIEGSSAPLTGSHRKTPSSERSSEWRHILVVEDESDLRNCLGEILRNNGFRVSYAGDGRQALTLLRSESLPSLIVLDLNMPEMDGWEFRTIQKDDPMLGLIPVLVLSADGSAKAAAISAQGYLCKPFDSEEVMAAVERVLSEDETRRSTRLTETERLASLGRLAANVGHEINNPLTFVTLNIRQSLIELRSSLRCFELEPTGRPSVEEAQTIKAKLASVAAMLEECESGVERIRGTVANLQQLSEKRVAEQGPLDVQRLLDESASMASNQIRHRAQLTKSYGEAAMVRGNRAALRQVFLNLIVNAAQSIPEGDAEGNEIQIATRLEGSAGHEAVVIVIRDSGPGMAPELVSKVFEPYFTTKPLGEGMGLGLSISRQTISDHGGLLTVESELGKGTLFRVVLPLGRSAATSPSPGEPLAPSALPRGRVLVVDDEPLIARIVQRALREEHDVVVVQRAAEALALLERGDAFDMVLCDLAMPDLSGPELYAQVLARWPDVAAQMVFMTGGAFTPLTVEFTQRAPATILQKPFALADLQQIVRDHVHRPS